MILYAIQTNKQTYLNTQIVDELEATKVIAVLSSLIDPTAGNYCDIMVKLDT